MGDVGVGGVEVEAAFEVLDGGACLVAFEVVGTEHHEGVGGGVGVGGDGRFPVADGGVG